MRVLLSGSSGLIGTSLARSLHDSGDEVRRLVRRTPTSPDEFGWDPQAGQVDPAAFDGVDAVVNLSGAPLAGRPWTPSYRATLRASRIGTTATLAREIARHPVSVFVSASAIGVYGDTGDATVDETAPAGTGFLAELVADWEAATTAAADAGVRTVSIRTGLVLSPHGGLLALLLPVFRLGLGGRIGSGRQWMSWISLDDEVAAIRYAIDTPQLRGPVNLTAPAPVTNQEFTEALARRVRRPALLPLPAWPLRLLLRDQADETLLVSQRVTPARLLDSGFTFRHLDIDAALAELV